MQRTDRFGRGSEPVLCALCQTVFSVRW
ncbi:hypothetical protein [uncultured Ruegeria sp.]